jgi:hypothetical protein
MARGRHITCPTASALAIVSRQGRRAHYDTTANRAAAQEQRGAAAGREGAGHGRRGRGPASLHVGLVLVVWVSGEGLSESRLRLEIMLEKDSIKSCYVGYVLYVEINVHRLCHSTRDLSVTHKR